MLQMALNLCRAMESRWKINCPTADSLVGPGVSKAIGWNMYDPDNAAYFACYLDAAIAAAAPAEDAEA